MQDFIDALRTHGAAHVTDPQGRVIMVASGSLFGVEPPALIIAYEGEGCLVLRSRSPITIFHVIAAGFSGPGAKVVIELLNLIASKIEEYRPEVDL